MLRGIVAQPFASRLFQAARCPLLFSVFLSVQIIIFGVIKRLHLAEGAVPLFDEQCFTLTWRLRYPMKRFLHEFDLTIVLQIFDWLHMDSVNSVWI